MLAIFRPKICSEKKEIQRQKLFEKTHLAEVPLQRNSTERTSFPAAKNW